MFITLKCNKENISVEQASASTAQGTRPRHAACTQCRVKKLKCSGDRDSCTACASNNLECIYPPPSRAKNGSAKRTRTLSQAQSPATQTSPPSPTSRNPPTPRLSTSSSSTSIEPDLDQFAWPADTSDPSGGYLDSFWKESPTSLEDLLGETAGAVFPDAGHDLFMDQPHLSSSEDMLQSNVDDALSALSSEIFGDPSLNIPFPNAPHHPADPSSMLLPPLGDADALSFAEFAGTTASSSSTDSPDTCRCMTDALVTLDALEAQKAAKSPCAHTMSGTLSTNKSALLQCSRVLECAACQHRPGCALLLILICRNLVSQFQQLLSGDLTTMHHASATKHPTMTMPMNMDMNMNMALTGRAAALGQYSIDTSEEQLQVLYALAIVRGRSLALFLEKLKSFVRGQSGAGHREKIESIECWHRSLMEGLKQMSYERI
ncbi:hypothetical protein BDV95DRAFT_603953 [Massariosphaeria phaeospora]|uniref:Zn(2)-C6 fungal-type domain-containing protein n=1 Tax=Massariosphaeria phaeospora TaxID=100035 RepID=A0A7C8IB59_9PLEO|nr:hypothetical protein BDV95DRAFT_603953 [Massariosphaeria phaeospora]